LIAAVAFDPSGGTLATGTFTLKLFDVAQLLGTDK
jgi:hypothetical protein